MLESPVKVSVAEDKKSYGPERERDVADIRMIDVIILRELLGGDLV